MILKPRPSASRASTTARTPTTTTTTRTAATTATATATASSRPYSDTLSSEEHEVEADALAADLVQSLSEELLLLLLDRQWTQQQQQQGTGVYSPPQANGGFETVAAARRKSLWLELGLPLPTEQEEEEEEEAGARGAAAAFVGADADAGSATPSDAGNEEHPAGVPADVEGVSLFEPDGAVGAAAAGSAVVAGAVAVGEGDTSGASVTAVASAAAVEEAGRQRLRGDGGQPGDAMTAAAAVKTMAEGFPEEKWEALGSRGLAAEEPLPAFGGGGGSGGVVAAAAACAEGGGGEEDFLKIESLWVNIALTFVCVVCAGLAAGLTMGLLSIEPLEMAIKQRSGE